MGEQPFAVRGSQLRSLLAGLMALSIAILMGVGVGVIAVLCALPAVPVLLMAAISAFALFFASFPTQRRLLRALDRRRPGLILDGSILRWNDRGAGLLLIPAVALSHGHCLIRSSYTDARSGVIRSAAMPQAWLLVGDASQRVLLVADDPSAVQHARALGWPEAPPPATSVPVLRLWAPDLLALFAQLPKQ